MGCATSTDISEHLPGRGPVRHNRGSHASRSLRSRQYSASIAAVPAFPVPTEEQTLENADALRGMFQREWRLQESKAVAKLRKAKAKAAADDSPHPAAGEPWTEAASPTMTGSDRGDDEVLTTLLTLDRPSFGSCRGAGNTCSEDSLSRNQLSLGSRRGAGSESVALSRVSVTVFDLLASDDDGEQHAPLSCPTDDPAGPSVDSCAASDGGSLDGVRVSASSGTRPNSASRYEASPFLTESCLLRHESLPGAVDDAPEGSDTPFSTAARRRPSATETSASESLSVLASIRSKLLRRFDVAHAGPKRTAEASLGPVQPRDAAPE